MKFLSKPREERNEVITFTPSYLTIKEYDMDMNTFLLDFPNDELKRGFVTLLTNNYLKPIENLDSWMSNAVLKLKQGDLEIFNLMALPMRLSNKSTTRATTESMLLMAEKFIR